jgi:hypothetical protein
MSHKRAYFTLEDPVWLSHELLTFECATYPEAVHETSRAPFLCIAKRFIAEIPVTVNLLVRTLCAAHASTQATDFLDQTLPALV